MEQSKSELIRGIIEQAEQQAQSAVDKAQKLILQREKSIEIQIKRIHQETEEKKNKQVEQILKNSESAIALLKKHANLKGKELIFNQIIDRVKMNIEEKIKSPEYPDILMNWIIEATLGLGADKVMINCSLKEKKLLTEDFLKKLSEKVLQLIGKKIEYEISEDPPLLGQGVVLSSIDGKTAYNNQVSSRIIREQMNIRKLIFQELFK